MISSVLFGGADFVGGLATRRLHVRVVVVMSQLAGLVTVIVVVLLSPPATVSGSDLIWGSLAGLSGMMGLLAFFQGLAYGRIAVVSPIAAITGATVPVVFGLLIGERPGAVAAIGVMVALPAVYLISLTDATQPRTPTLWRDGLAMGALGGLGFGGFFILISRTAEASGLWPLVSARATTVAVLGFVVAVSVGFRRPTRPVAWLIVASGVLDILANAAFVLAARNTLLALASVITALYPATTILLARLVLNERTFPIQRVGLALGGAAVVAIAAG